MKQVFYLVLVVIIAIVAFFLYFKVFKIETTTFDKTMLETVDKVNEASPVMVDADTRLDGAIKLHGKTIQYNYTLIGVLKDSINIQTLQTNLEPMIIKAVKFSAELKVFRDSGATLEYSYKDKNGVPLLKIYITPEDYNIK